MKGSKTIPQATSGEKWGLSCHRLVFSNKIKTDLQFQLFTWEDSLLMWTMNCFSWPQRSPFLEETDREITAYFWAGIQLIPLFRKNISSCFVFRAITSSL
jgi:hypothetical protein